MDKIETIENIKKYLNDDPSFLNIFDWNHKQALFLYYNKEFVISKTIKNLSNICRIHRWYDIPLLIKCFIIDRNITKSILYNHIKTEKSKVSIRQIYKIFVKIDEYPYDEYNNNALPLIHEVNDTKEYINNFVKIKHIIKEDPKKGFLIVSLNIPPAKYFIYFEQIKEYFNKYYLLSIINSLKKENELLKNMLDYQPEGDGYKLVKKEFESLTKNINKN